MDERYVSLGIWVVVLLLLVGVWLRRKHVTIGPAAAATMHEIMNDERRAAVEIILEERAAERDPEDRDGNLPDLEHPSTTRESR